MSATTIDVYVTSPPVVDVTIVSDPVFEVLGVLPTGPRGPAGEQGEQGIQGIQGIPGNDGTDGADGAPGADGEGVPTGGTAGQVLTKDSGTDFDTSWQDPDGGSGVVETIVAGSNIDVDATDPANPIVSVEALVDADIPASIARDSEVTAAVAAEAALARNADNLTSGTVADARIAATIARDSEVAAGYQPLDADLTALAAAGNSAVLAATTASFLTADETKLDGIEAGAQVNPTSEAIQDIVGAMVSGGTETGIAVTYDDPNGRLDFVAEVTQAELDAVEDGLVSAIADGDSSTLTSAQSYADGKVSDTAYGAGWNADTTHAPSKNAVYDKIESLGGGSVSDTAYDSGWNGDTTVAPSKNAVYDEMELRVPRSLFDANTILKADTDNTPAALTMGASTVLARLASGNIVAATPAQIRTLLAIPTVQYVVGNKAGNHSTTSSALADVDAQYSISAPAVAGDRLEIELNCTVFHSNNAATIRFTVAIAGTDLATGVVEPDAAVANEAMVIAHRVFYVVQSGDISGGTVACKPRWRTSSSTATMLNEGTVNRSPVFSVKNWGQ